MKKALAMLLLAGLAFLPMASFADVVDESLGQGAGFEAALNTGSSDLIQIFPQKAEDFASAVFLRYGEPDYGRYIAGNNDDQFQVLGSDNWMGIVDKKLGLGTLGVYTNVPVNFFTNDAGGFPDLAIRSWYGGWSSGNHGGTTNDWFAISNKWHVDYPNYASLGPVGMNNPVQAALYNGPSGAYFATPQNKVMLVYADQGFGLSLNYGDVAGAAQTDFTGNTYTDGDNDAVLGNLGYKKVTDSGMEFGGSVGYGTKDAGMFSTFDVAGSFELGLVDQSRINIYENNDDDGSVVHQSFAVKDGNGGIYDVRLSLLATKDTDEMTQVRLSATGVLGKLGISAINSHDGGDNDGDFENDGSSVKHDTSYDNLNINVNAGVVHKIEAGNGRVVASLGVNYRDQTLKDDQKWWDVTDQRYEYIGPDWFAQVNGTILKVPVRVGVEQDLTGWLTLRLGASTNAFQYYWGKAIIKSDTEDNIAFEDTATLNTASDSFQNVEFNTGLGVKLGNFTFDMLLDQNWVEDQIVAEVEPGAGVFYDQEMAYLAKFQATFKY